MNGASRWLEAKLIAEPRLAPITAVTSNDFASTDRV
jgi:hypothetical protein